jgi:RHS repeat-associated protein
VFGIRGGRGGQRRFVRRATQTTEPRPPGEWTLAVALAVAVLVAVGPVSPRSAGASDAPAQELVNKRTATSSTFRNADGSFTTSAYAAPIHYLDSDGKWQNIDSRLVPSPLSSYAWTNSANSFHAHFKDQLGDDYLRFAVRGRPFTLSLLGALKAKAAVQGPRIHYAGALDGVALDYAVRADGLEETLSLANGSVPTQYQFTLDPQGVPLSPRQLPGGSWAFMTPRHHGPLFLLAAPRAADALGKDGSRHAQLEVKRTGKTFSVVLSVDVEWLHDAARAFPVRIDPTITIQPSLQTGNFITTCGSCTDTATPLWIGTDDTDVWRALVQFDLSSIPPGATVTAASFGLWNDSTSCIWVGAGDCGTSSHTLEAHRVTNAWNTTTTTSSQLGFDATILSTFTLAAHAPDQWMTWNVATTAQNWLNGTQPNYGILIKRATEPIGVGGPAPPGNDAFDPTQAPKLDITYKSDGVILYAPSTLHANGADLRWSQWDGSTGNAFGGYEIHRSQSASFTPSASTLVATIKDPAITTYHDTTAAPNKSFTYKVVVNGVVSVGRTVTLPADGQATIPSAVLTPQTSQETYLEDVTGTADCNNYGGSDALFIGTDTDGAGTNWKYRPVVSFDVRSIPAGATVTSANLQMYADYMPPATTVTVEAHRITSAWKEGTGGLWTSPDYCTGDGATWLETQGGVRWKTAGGDFDPTVAASVSHTANDQAKWDSFNLASIVQQWVSGTSPNLGVLFKFSNETPLSGNWFAYDSDYDTWDPTLKPKLSLAYTDGSHSIAPTVSIGSPAPGVNVGGTVTVTAGASDDGQIAKVDFYVDNVLKSTSTSAPYQFSWNTTTVAAGNHSLKAIATDDAGNQTTSNVVTVNVDNSAAPTTSVTSPVGGATVSGTASVTASATDDRSVSHVEFYVDGNRFTDTATAPYTASLNTTDTTEPVYDGSHDLTTKAYDAGGHVTTSAPVTITVKNAPSGSQYADAFSSTEFPAVVTYDPSLQTQQSSGVTVTVTNKSSVSWGSNISLRYRWISNDPTPVYTDGPSVSLGGTVAPNASANVTMMVPAPALPDGVERSRYTLRFDLYEGTAGIWFAAKGAQPLENPVIVNKALVRDALGLERYYHYTGADVGAAMKQLTNVSNGNSILRWTPFDEDGRGLSTVLDLTYNALEKKCDCPAGNNWSMTISSLSRFGNPIDIHPNKADQIAGNANKFIEFTDGDGTTHRFTDSNNDGYWEAPAGVHLYLRATGSSDPNKYWAFTRPDRVTFYYDQSGFPQSVVDGNGNTLTFTESSVAPADDPGGPKFKITKVTDAGGRAFNITYFTKADAKKPQIRGKVKSITDHLGRELDFDYYFDGNLLRITQKGGTNPDGSFLPDRSFVFTYTTSDGSGPAIPLAANRVNPDPGTANESTRIYSVRDPRGNETLFAYLGPGFGTDRWKIASLTDRATKVTSFAYDTVNRVTTVTEPLSRVSKYAYDVEGKVTKITNPLNQDTLVAWSADRAVSKVTEPTLVFTSFTYNDNGYLTSMTDQLGNQTQITYANSAVDANDVSGKWEPGRTIPHISDLATKTDPKGVATTTIPNDYQWTFGHDSKGNVTSVTDPLGSTTTLTYNGDGTLASAKQDANNHVTSYPTYDANGLATTIVDPIGNATGDTTNHRTTIAFNAAGEVLSVQDAVHQSFGAASRSNVSFFDYDRFGRMVRQSAPKSTAIEPGKLIWSSGAFDANDNLVSQTYPHYGTTTDPGGDATTMTYDVMDRLTLQVVPHDPTSSDPAQQNHKTTYAYDAAGRLTIRTDPKGVLTTNTDKDFATFLDYDALDRAITETRYEVDGAGNITKTQRAHGCYDLAGDLRSVTTPRGDGSFPGCPAAATPYTPLSGNYTTSYAYDAAHKLLSTTDALGRKQSLTYDANGDADSFTDEAGIVSTRILDPKGQVIKETQPFRSGTNAKNLITQYKYDPVGNVTKLITPRAYDASTDKVTFTQYVTTYEYDENDRLIRELLPTSSSDTQQLYVHHAYDGDGRQIWTSLTTDQAVAANVAASEKSQFTYFDPGWLRTSKDPAEPQITFDYTAKGEQASRTRAQGVNDPTADKTELWTYFVGGDLKQEIDPHGSPITYGYDADGNLTDLDDTAGVQTSDETPIVVQQTYDGFDRVVKTRQQKLGKPWHFTTYAYDLNDNIVNAEDDAIESPATPGRKTDYTFDQADQLVDQVDHGLQSGCSDDQRVQYTYLATGNLQDEIVSRPSATCTDTAPGWVAKEQTTHTYFLDGSPSTEKVWNGPSATATLMQSNTLAYEDASGVYLNGNIASNTIGIASPNGQPQPCPVATPCTLTYGYDAKDRLISYGNGRGGSTTYTMLPSGLLKTEAYDKGDGTLKYTKTYDYYNPNGVQLKTLRRDQTLPIVTHSLRRFFYLHGNIFCVAHDDLDASGVTVTQADRDRDCPSPAGGTISPRLEESYGYDDLDRLSGYHAYFASSQTDSGQWSYDALDRVSTEQETHPGVSRSMTFDYIGLSSDAAKETWTGSGATTRSYSYDVNGNKVGLTDTGRNANLLYAYNAHGDVSQLLTLGGAAQAAYGYRPYGDEEAGQNAISQGDSGDSVFKSQPGVLNNYRYSAKRFDTANRSINMGARFFSPDYGSFLQEDYLREALGDLDLASDPLTGTRYGLAGGNPINFVEIDGHGFSDFARAVWHVARGGAVGYANFEKNVWLGVWEAGKSTAGGLWYSAQVGWDLAPLLLRGDLYGCWKDRRCRNRVGEVANTAKFIVEHPKAAAKSILSPCVTAYRKHGFGGAVGCASAFAVMAVGTEGIGVEGTVAGRAAAVERALVGAARTAKAITPRRSIVELDSAWGTRVHTTFAQFVEALRAQGLPVWDEVVYRNGRYYPGRRRPKGSIVADVVVGDPRHPIAIYDLKTGKRGLTPARIRQIRRHLPPGYKNIPIRELR